VLLIQHRSGQFAGLAAAPDGRTAHAACGGGLALGQQGTGAHGPVSSPARTVHRRPAIAIAAVGVLATLAVGIAEVLMA